MASQSDKEVNIIDLNQLSFTQDRYVLLTDDNGATGRARGDQLVTEVQQAVEENGVIAELAAQVTEDKALVAANTTATQIAKTAAENAAATAQQTAQVYETEAIGRAAVANGQTFMVKGTGDVASKRYRRTDSSTSVFEADLPSLQATLSGTTALAKTVAIDNQADALTKKTTGVLLRNLPVPLGFTRNTSTGAAASAGNMAQVENADRSVVITGFTDQTVASLITDMQTAIPSTGITKIQFDFVASAAVTTDPMVGIGYVAGAERIIYLWRPTGLVSYTKSNTATFSQIHAATAVREYVMGDKCRMELVFSGSTVTLNIYKGTNYTLLASTSTIPSTLLPTGDFIVGSRGSMNFTYTLTTYQSADIAKAQTDAQAYADTKDAILQAEIDDVTLISANILSANFVADSSYRNSDGAIAATTGTKRSAALVEVLPNTQYTLKNIRTNFVGNEYSANDVGTRVAPISSVAAGATILSYTWVTGPTTHYLGLNLSSGGYAVTDTMLVQGPTAPDNFEAYGKRYLDGADLRGQLPADVELAAVRRMSNNLLVGGFVSNEIYRNGDGTIGSSVTASKRTANLIPVLPNTEYTIINARTGFLGNEYDNTGIVDNTHRVRVIAPNISGLYSTYTFTTSATTYYLGINVVISNTLDTSAQAWLILGRVIPKAYETPGQKYTNGANIRGPIPGVDLPNVYYSFDPTGFNDAMAGSDQGTGLFTVYCRYSQNSQFYAAYRIGHVLNSTIRADLWRIVGADLFKWNGTTMVNQSMELLTDSESEFVWREQGKTDFTGGYHGDEYLTEAYFYINSVRLSSLASAIPISPASDFWYIQKSNMIETDNVTVVNRCVHHKDTKFLAGGFTTKNRVIWSGITNVSIFYPGLVTVSHNQSGIVYNEDYSYQTTTAPAVQVDFFHSPGGAMNGQHEIKYFNPTTELGALVSSRITKAVKGSTDNTALYDSMSEIFVRDNVSYAKCYRGFYPGQQTPTPILTAAGEIWEAETTFKPYKKAM